MCQKKIIHFDDPVALMRNARPALKPDGKLAIGDWLPSNDNKSEYSTPEKMEAQMNAAGYKLERIDTFLKENDMYIYIFSIDSSQ